MRTSICHVPQDVISIEIIPYLDYNSRISMNLVLPFEERVYKPLRKHTLLAFSIKLSSCIIKKLLIKIEETKNIRYRSTLLLKLWRTLPKHPHLFQYSIAIRTIMKAKIIELTDSENPDIASYSYYTLRTLRTLCNEMYDLMETRYSYIGELNSRSWVTSTIWRFIKA